MSGALSPEVKHPELGAECSCEPVPRLRMRETARLTPRTVLSCEVKGTIFRNSVFEKLEKYTICIGYTKS